MKKALAFGLLASVLASSAHAESIKIGISKLIGYPGVPIVTHCMIDSESGIHTRRQPWLAG